MASCGVASVDPAHQAITCELVISKVFSILLSRYLTLCCVSGNLSNPTLSSFPSRAPLSRASERERERLSERTFAAHELETRFKLGPDYSSIRE